MAVFLGMGTGAPGGVFRGRVVDSATLETLPARVYLQAEDGRWHFVQTADPEGTAVVYQEQWVPMPDSVERHTTVSGHAFKAEVPDGRYRVTVERGKEYLPLEREVTVGAEAREEVFRLVRIADMAERGWYSGETHVHRRIEELPNVMLAEDLNVAFPVTFWTTVAGETPTTEPSPLRPVPDPAGARKDVGAEPIYVDSRHVIMPRNTEYEIFSVGENRRHILGALFILNHQERFEGGMPPVSVIAEEAHRQGALLDLDKHNWPWSLMLVPVASVDLFELANNSVWRTAFGFRTSVVPPPEWMNIERDEKGMMTEWGWIDFGFQTYYALLNCGFDMKPTAGTASGVHPVPLGYGRVYVHVDGPFEVGKWLEGLRKGRSFVTTGPLLTVATLDQRDPGERFYLGRGSGKEFRLELEARSARPLEGIELVVNGAVARRWTPDSEPLPQGGYVTKLAEAVPVDSSCWLAVRCFERQGDGRVRFAHTGPFHVEMGGEGVRPTRREVSWLIGRMKEEIKRNAGVLSEEAISEFRRALEVYEAIERSAREE